MVVTSVKGGVTGIVLAQHTYVHTTYYIRSVIHIMVHFYTQTVVKEGMYSLHVVVGTDYIDLHKELGTIRE